MGYARNTGATLLRAWLAGRTRGWLAKEVGCSAPTITYWLRGDVRPSYSFRKRIETMTDGEVPAGSWDVIPRSEGAA